MVGKYCGYVRDGMKRFWLYLGSEGYLVLGNSTPIQDVVSECKSIVVSCGFVREVTFSLLEGWYLLSVWVLRDGGWSLPLVSLGAASCGVDPPPSFNSPAAGEKASMI